MILPSSRPSRLINRLDVGDAAIAGPHGSRGVLFGDVVHEQSQPLQCRHQSVVALQGGVLFGAVDNQGGFVAVSILNWAP